jgi:hypothetical protein
MIIDPKTLGFTEAGDQITIDLSGKCIQVDRVVRAFPRSHPDGYVSFLDGLGHEIGLLETMDGMEPQARSTLADFLKRQYFVPTISEILTVEISGTTSVWKVVTDDGERSFTVAGREALDGDRPPEIRIVDSAGQKYRIQDFWALDKTSRKAVMELLPDKILKSKLVARNSKGMTMRMR